MLVDIVLGVWFVVMPCAMIVILWQILKTCQSIFWRINNWHMEYHEYHQPAPEPVRFKVPSVPHDPKRDKELRRRYIEKMKLAKEAEK